MKVIPLTEFTSLGLAEPIARAIADEGYTTPTPIQSQAIPPALSGRDLIGIAQTGTGKTAAFALPILNALAADPQKPTPQSTRVLILCPTRELGGQIVDSFHAYGRYLRIKTVLAIGGVPIGKQRRALQGGVDVLVATPGRLLDLTNTGAVTLRNVSIFVLDEADRMLDMGFIRDIRKIVALVPKVRQTLFFSATMPPEIERLANDMLNEPVRVAVTPAATTVELIDQRAIRVERAGKPKLLAETLRDPSINRALVFTRTKHGADRVVRGLTAAGIPSAAIHGNKTQGNRERTMSAFRSGEIRTLVATDIAARGIDVDGVSHVVNFDLPNIPETYVHRIGRTARAGASGTAISFVSGEEMEFLRDIEKLIRMKVPTTGAARSEQPQQDNLGQRQEQQDRGNRGERKPHRGQRHNGQRHRNEGGQQRQHAEGGENRHANGGNRRHEQGAHRSQENGEQRTSGNRRDERGGSGHRGQRPASHEDGGHRRHENAGGKRNAHGGKNRNGQQRRNGKGNGQGHGGQGRRDERGPRRDPNSRPGEGIGGVGFMSRPPRGDAR